MKLDYIDMMIIHSPQPWLKFGKENRYFEGNLEAWRALEEAYKEGKLRVIGVSNFLKADLDNILNNCTVKPMVNQILAHIGNTPDKLIEYTKKQDILVEAYSPVAHGELMKNDAAEQMAVKYGVTIPQLGIRYTLQLGLLPLPKTANPAHMKNNADVDFEISDEDMDFLINIERIKDYGAVSVMPVFGGKLNLKAVIKSIARRKKK
jgi:diketogulonate reductase-like aldo/keto reductase